MTFVLLLLSEHCRGGGAVISLHFFIFFLVYQHHLVGCKRTETILTPEGDLIWQIDGRLLWLQRDIAQRISINDPSFGMQVNRGDRRGDKSVTKTPNRDTG